MAAVANNGLALDCASTDSKQDINVVTKAVSQNGLALKFADELRKNCDIINIAIKNNLDAIAYAIYTSNKKSKNQTEKEIQEQNRRLKIHRDIAITAINSN
jgi:hypothetical protein